MRFDKYHRIILQLLVICMLVTPLYCPVSAEAAAAASASSVEADNSVPGAVTLTTATSSAYNKITVRWRRTSGATHYLVYYKKADAPKWIKLASVPASQLEYTHISTKAFPIYVGRDYLYTVKAYNEKTRKAGAYNRKGLTARTYPNKVTLKDAVYNSAGTAVTVSWGKAPGGHYFRVYRKTDSSPGWKRIGIVPADQYSFVDKNPVKGEKNVYTVHAYNKNSKVYGKYDAAGVTARTRRTPRPSASQICSKRRRPPKRRARSSSWSTTICRSGRKTEPETGSGNCPYTAAMAAMVLTTTGMRETVRHRSALSPFCTASERQIIRDPRFNTARSRATPTGPVNTAPITPGLKAHGRSGAST